MKNSPRSVLKLASLAIVTFFLASGCSKRLAFDILQQDQARLSAGPQNPQAASDAAVLSWDANSESDLAGYKVHYGDSSGGPYTNTQDVGQTSNPSGPAHTISGLAGGIYFFVVSAYDSSGNESGFSNEASKTISGIAP